MRAFQSIEEIKSYENMFYAGRQATAYYYGVCLSDPNLLPKNTTFRVRDILECHEDLEHTYLIRIFTVFERTIRQHYVEQIVRRNRHPHVKFVLDRVASNCYVRSDVHERAHKVREFRNSLVHGGATIALTFSEARSYLCTFLSNLPRGW